MPDNILMCLSVPPNYSIAFVIRFLKGKSTVLIHRIVLGKKRVKDIFDHEEVSTGNARYSGFCQFEECLGYCKFCSPYPKTTLKAFNAITGWNLILDDVYHIGRRINHALRVFSFRHGLDIATERPSKRYGSVPEGGFAAGKDIMARWDFMLENYYKRMGWDPKTGRPLDETLKNYNLGNLIGTF